MISGMIRYRDGRIILPNARKPENAVEASLALVTLHRSVKADEVVLWLEPPSILAFLPREGVDIAVLDRTGEVERVHCSGLPESSISLLELMKAPLAIVGKGGTLFGKVTVGMVLFWQDRPMLPLHPRTPKGIIRAENYGESAPAYVGDVKTETRRVL